MTDDEALDAALATATSPDALHALAEHHEFAVREAVAGNPSARRATIALLLDWISGHESGTPRRDIPAAVLGNASLPLWLLDDPTFLVAQPRGAVMHLARSTALTPLLWSALASHPDHLVKLALLRSPVAPPDAWARLGLLSVDTIELSELSADEDDVMALLQAPSPFLATSLKLSCNRAVGDRFFTALASSSLLENLTRLAADSTGIGPRGVRALASSSSLSKLEYLELSNTETRDVDVIALAESAAFPRLRILGLSTDVEYPGSSIGDTAAIALARASSLTELRVLDLDSTSVLDDGVIALARSSAFPRLEKLVLSGTGIGNAALLALASSPLLDTLHTLDVGGCGHLPAMTQLREAVARRPGLTLRG